MSILFAFPFYEYLAKELQLTLNFSVGTFALKRFPNNELRIKLYTEVKSQTCLVLGSLNPPEINLLVFLFLCHTLKKENARKIIAIFPYLAYSRQDKKKYHESYATALMGKLLMAAGVDKVITLDIHSRQAKRLYPISLRSLSPAAIFFEAIKKLTLDDISIVAPDEGAITRCRVIAKKMKIYDIAYMIKERTEQGITHNKLVGAISKQAIIIDDILDTGKTLVSCCEKLCESGVKEIYIFVTHGLFTGNEWGKLWQLRVKHIYCTNTLPLPIHISNQNITVLSINSLLADALIKYL